MSRRRYRFDPETKRMVEVDDSWTETPRRAPVGTEELVYGKLRATDGTVLDTRRKHREYMRQHGYAVASDFTETWARAEREREGIRRGENDKRPRREALERAWHELSSRRK